MVTAIPTNAVVSASDGDRLEYLFFALLLAGSGLFESLLPLTLVPVYLTYCSYKVFVARRARQQARIRELADLHAATAETLAMAIEAMDQTTHSHIRRVQLYACALGESVGLNGRDLEGIRTAALLHDIGKLGIPEHILSKPGPLTADEFQKVREHPQIGADIISSVPFPYPVAPLILNHHERWDGTGYPAGRRGDDIPLGARIISVADVFDAIMTERPYHKALSLEAAMALLRHEAGKALDPALVLRFVELLPWLEQQVVQEDSLARRASTAGRTSSIAEPARDTAFDQIALAHRQIYALYEIAQSMGTSLAVPDTMALISGKLRDLVPFSCAALFVVSHQGDVLECRFATGTDADIVKGLVCPDLGALAESCAATSMQSVLVSPLVCRDRVIGALALYHVDRNYYAAEHRRLLDRVAEPAAAVLHKSLTFEQTREDALTDPLTGLPNRRFLFTHLSRELARADRCASEVALVVMDMDAFKQINDGHGHQVGDRALRTVAGVLRAAIRPYDICVRYAGDEFIVVLSGCAAAQAAEICQQLQRAIKVVRFEARPGRRVPLSISVGTAVYPADGQTSEALLAAADHRMYRDKGTRRHRVPSRRGVAGAPVSASLPAESIHPELAVR